MERKEIELTVEAFSRDGFGLAHLEGVPVEIPFTMPGDTVVASLARRRRGAYAGRLEQLVKPSEDRVAPRCAHFAVCGGCRWQHVPYDRQLEIKEATVRRAFDGLDAQVFPIVGCDPPWAYRNKMEFSFSSDTKGQRFLGLMMKEGRSRVFNLTECHLVDPWMAKAVVHVRDWWGSSTVDAYHPPSNRGSLRTLILRHGFHSGDRLAMLTVSGNPDFAVSKKDIEGWAAAMRDSAPPSPGRLSLFLRIQQIAKGRATQFFEMLLEGPDHVREQLQIAAEEGSSRSLNFKIAPSAFFQPNPRQAQKLYSRALQMVTLSPDAVVYDLCCGTGALGIAVAPYVKQVIGIELSPEASLDARGNAAENDCPNVTIYTGDVGRVLEQLKTEGKAPDPQLVIVDPPRSGLTPEAIQQILGLGPQQILYVSCNPVTQADNVRQLLQGGYRLIALQPVDQFPQTVHIENIAVLKRIPG